ncbi:NAD(P)-dependent dehydrogenase (short-subunit alcohol dehydrogenase family) [Isoptericola sp. CG 20/1183]|uniref:NAD(P)-dependent dehydrogenase (Short-subunit alcohol dehydrogenase family) n=1 Tax=Isoptericola halotolerans TaxID=300560 RepID=A0ABX5EGL7_9MICO|nr:MULTISPECIES: SDR family NAD(P)-dependent oxidoreductase [Isoptericola]PRZ06945.1 NAD(P)-dependent dehydrogenase (short-subunit alcohol dehydrogenase family) [Isoptericola halotolerans]PRZ07383.1 NAD(P)-dependent dehydrogenase (short-subunit alcohol dehydrogenase family) [Isoptericola sp. CG 20/1183]
MSDLTLKNTVAQWLADPVGEQALTEMLTEAGASVGSLAPARRLSLAKLVKLSRGKFSVQAAEALVARAAELRAAGADAPATAEADGDGDGADVTAAAAGSTGSPEPAEWVEHISAGRFTGQTVVVTGAASGIGRATASRVAREGGRVVAVDMTRAGLDELVAETELPAGATIVTVVADITDDAGVARIVEAAGDRVHALANVAGIMDRFAAVHTVDDATWEKVFAVNVTGTMKLMRAVVPGMLAAAEGRIVNVASEAGLRGSASGAAYTASKHAVVGLTRNAAFMYTGTGVRVNAVAPGGVATGMQPRDVDEFGMGRVRSAMGIMADIAMPEQLAASITFLLSADSTNVNGQVVASDGGWSAA